jgi:hypothetical protein
LKDVHGEADDVKVELSFNEHGLYFKVEGYGNDHGPGDIVYMENCDGDFRTILYQARDNEEPTGTHEFHSARINPSQTRQEHSP